MDVQSKLTQGSRGVGHNGRTLMLALVFYTITVCMICYMIILPASTVVIQQQQQPATVPPPQPAAAVQKKATKETEEFIFSQSRSVQSTNNSTLSDHPAPQVNDSTSNLEDNEMKEEEMEDAVQKPSVSQYYKSMKDHKQLEKTCSTCAIVSSSGQLLGKGAGEQIDNSSCVLRMNVAPITGFEEDVGSKTTLRVVCFISAKALQNKASTMLSGPNRTEMLMFWGLNQSKHKGARTIAEDLSRRYGDSVQFYSQSFEGEDIAGRLFQREIGYNRLTSNSWLSTGWFTVMLALDVCEEVHMYGMVPDDHCKTHQKVSTRYHYFQKDPNPTECSYYNYNEVTTKGGHRFITEKAIFARWGKQYNMKFHYPEWDLSGVNLSKPLNTPFSRKQSVLEAHKHRRQRSTDILLKVIAILGALLCVAGVLGIYTYPCDSDTHIPHERYRLGQRPVHTM